MESILLISRQLADTLQGMEDGTARPERVQWLRMGTSETLEVVEMYDHNCARKAFDDLRQTMQNASTMFT